MKRGRRPLPPPWRRPSRILWFVLAVIGACWLTLHMPESHVMRPKPEQNGTSAPTSRMHRPAPVSESMDADVGEDAVTSSGPTKMDTAAPRMKRHAPLTPAEKIFAKMKTFGRLFAIVGIAAFLVFYFVFKFAITKFDLKTPGREDEDAEEAEKKVVLANNNYTEVAAGVLKAIGGKENVSSVDYCATRLRFTIKDYTAVDEKAVKAAGAAGVIRPDKTTCQVIIGTKVQFVYDELKKML